MIGNSVHQLFECVWMCQWPTGIILLSRFFSLCSCLIIGKLCVPNTAFVHPVIASAIKIALSRVMEFSRRSVNRSGCAGVWRKYCACCGWVNSCKPVAKVPPLVLASWLYFVFCSRLVWAMASVLSEIATRGDWVCFEKCRPISWVTSSQVQVYHR
jgi:hypothetical protein